MTIDLTGRIALVTGASSGIGRAMALKIAKAGAHIIATARTTSALEDLENDITHAGGQCTSVPLDLLASDGIEHLGKTVEERWGKLDILLACAGQLGVLTPTAQVTPTSWNTVLGVNLFAPARLISAFEALLLNSDAGRAIFISSGSAIARSAYWAPYCTSKSGLDALVISWANEHRSNPLRINVVYPCAVRTKMRAKVCPGEDPMSLPLPVELWPVISQLISPDCVTHGEIINITFKPKTN